MSSELVEHVRYGKFVKGRRRGHRRSTLVTLRKDNTLFFGISKCHGDKDKWNSEEGLKRARVRAQAALSMWRNERDGNYNPKWVNRGGVVIHEDGIIGHCSVDNVKKLLYYFNVVTSYLPKNWIEYEVRETRRKTRDLRRAKHQLAMKERERERIRLVEENRSVTEILVQEVTEEAEAV